MTLLIRRLERTWSSFAEASIPNSLHPIHTGKRDWQEIGSVVLKFEASGRTFLRRRAKQAAIAVLFVAAARSSEFRTAEDSRLALLGAFGYDLLLQFDPIRLRLPGVKPRHCTCFFATRFTSWIAKRKLSSDFSSTSPGTRGLPKAWTGLSETIPKS